MNLIVSRPNGSSLLALFSHTYPSTPVLTPASTAVQALNGNLTPGSGDFGPECAALFEDKQRYIFELGEGTELSGYCFSLSGPYSLPPQVSGWGVRSLGHGSHLCGFI